MPHGLNALRWDGAPGHYEVHYLSATDRRTGVGLWIRYTMLAPLGAAEATCALWFMAMDPKDPAASVARKRTLPIASLQASEEPFELRLGDATLTDRGMAGGFEDVRWDLEWDPGAAGYEHVAPMLQRARIAKTVLVLPHADLAVRGTVAMAGRELTLDGARGGQAHLWGSKHAARWAWVHCNDLETLEGEPRPGAFVDGVSVVVPRFGREVGPSTPVVGRFGGADFLATSPRSVLRAPSRFTVTSWDFEVRAGSRRLVAEVTVRREDLVGVTYHDPDGDTACCYNTEVADLRLNLWERRPDVAGGWGVADTLVAPGRAHFEYAQRAPVPGLDLALR
jgi:hypothetical protein